MEYIAHITEDGEQQSVYDHLKGVARRVAEFAAPFHAESQAEQIGWAHDIGKYSLAFQKRILEQGTRVDHSTAGAVELFEKRNLYGALCVAGHHGGLPDCGAYTDTCDMPTLCGRVKRKTEGKLADYSAYANEIALRQVPELDWTLSPLNAYYYVKMLFSCLVDADFLDTEEFMEGRERSRCSTDTFEILRDKLNQKIEVWQNPTTELNQIRCQILNRCIAMGIQDKGLYSLTVPTGGGKTVASLAFALNQACRHQMQRVIYVIPYTSIIDQNAAVFADILGKQNVLAHYSEAVYDDKEELDSRKKLATENWDIPVVVTTSVQFFESFYSNKTSKSRKLHNIANSVVIFDEYQLLPVKHMKPCTEVIYQLVRNYGCTALLCTATQPGTTRFFHGMECQEIVEDVPWLFEKLARVRYEQAGKLDTEDLCGRLMSEEQVLCVVNTRKTAQEIYTSLSGEGNYHLSTLMVPKHRRAVLKEICSALEKKKCCRVISTSLIEAGVDVDFPTVYREENGLDSVIQAAGRCNREGKRALEDSRVWIFRLECPCPISQRINRDSMVETLQLGYEIGSPETIQKYFNILFDAKGEKALDEREIISLCEQKGENGPLPFRTIAERFRLIDQDTRTVYVPYDSEGVDLTERLAAGERTRELFRELGPYGVNLYLPYYNRLRDNGVLLEYDENAVILSDLSLYSMETGLAISSEKENTGFFI